MSAAPADPRSRGSHLVEMRFFVLPVDSGSNNIRILVNRAEIVSIEKASPAA